MLSWAWDMAFLQESLSLVLIGLLDFLNMALYIPFFLGPETLSKLLSIYKE